MGRTDVFFTSSQNLLYLSYFAHVSYYSHSNIYAKARGDGQANRKVKSLKAAWKGARASFRRQEKGKEDVEGRNEYKGGTG